MTQVSMPSSTESGDPPAEFTLDPAEQDKRSWTERTDAKKQVVDARKSNEAELDKWLLTLGSGIYALSFTFIQNIAPAPAPNTHYFLLVGWAAVVACIFGTLYSLYAGVMASNCALDADERCSKLKPKKAKAYWKKCEKRRKRWIKLMDSLAWWGVMLFGGGLLFLVLFAWSNVALKAPPTSAAGSSGTAVIQGTATSPLPLPSPSPTVFAPVQPSVSASPSAAAIPASPPTNPSAPAISPATSSSPATSASLPTAKP